MRSKKALMNSISSMTQQITAIICGLILPRLILAKFGSNYNGITQSITQFMECIVLLRAGIGGVTRAALYKPLAEDDKEQISGIVNATQLFMRKIAIIFLFLVIAFASVYPIFVKDEFGYWFSFSLVVIISLSTVAQNYFGVSYQMLIQADQRQYIYSFISIATTILNTIIASILIIMGANIHIVKLASAIVFTAHPIILSVYVKNRYCIDKTVKPNKIALSQRWDAFAQQVASFINNNTDVMVLTIFVNIREVSVYTVYYMIAGSLRRLVEALTSGIDAAFGNMIAQNEKQALDNSFNLIEFVVFFIATFAFTCCAILIVPFAKLYTEGIDDANYVRYLFGALMSLSQFLFIVRIPYQLLVNAAGHFKQTRNGAIIECILNLVISIVLVIKFGLIGVTIGTIVALIFRNLQYSLYASKHILKRKFERITKLFATSFIEIVAIGLIVSKLNFMEIHNYFDWFVYAVVIAILVFVILISTSFLLYKQELYGIYNKINSMIKKN